jgi:L-ascorbate metabolism protein UlaG (beta-lactamase superfamily)
VIELDWWDIHTHEGVQFHLVPVQHWSARGLGDRNQTLWGGWAVFAPDLRWYFSGDAGTAATSRKRARSWRRTHATARCSTSRCWRSAPTSRAGS